LNGGSLYLGGERCIKVMDKYKIHCKKAENPVALAPATILLPF
jgi:hypothetical protein